MHKNGSSSANYSTRKVDGRKIDKRGGSNKGMADGFFFKEIPVAPWLFDTSEYSRVYIISLLL